MTPYEERMKESRARRLKIIRLSKKDPAPSHQQIATEVRCSRAYVSQTLKAANAEKPSEGA